MVTQNAEARNADDKVPDATASVPQTDAAPAGNKAAASEPPTGYVAPTELPPPSSTAKADDKGLPGARSDAPDAGPADADTAAADPATADAAGEDAAAIAPKPDESPEDQPSGIAAQLASWITHTRDNGKRPFAVIDKVAARIFVFGPDGTLRGAAPVLVGLAAGDDSAPGIGDRALSAITPDERTTPAGRFVAKFGPASGNKRVLWVDYADAISLHPVVTTNPKEHRLKRIKSAAAEDHRISYGCINGPARFYEHVVLQAFGNRGGIVYILPDTRPLHEVFPAFAATLGASAAGDWASQADAIAQPAAGVDDPDHPVDTQHPQPTDRTDQAAADQDAQPVQSPDPPAADDPGRPVGTEPSLQATPDTP